MSDPFRSTYKSLSEAESKHIASIKDSATTLYNLIAWDLKSSREQAIALTKLEEAVMWAVKHYTK